MAFRPDVEQALAQSAARYGVDLETMRRIAQIESGGNPAAQNPSSSAGGLFQFIDGTAKQYGLKDKYDPYQSADAGARLLRDNSIGLTKALGRAPTSGELYLAHQQGLGGATKLLTNPNARAADIVGGKAVSLNAGSPDMTAGQFAAQWVNKANGVKTATAPQGVAGLAPQAAAAIPTLGGDGAVNAAATATAPAADPMSGIFGLLLQQKMTPQAPVAMAQPMQRKAPDTRSDEEKLASVSQTPDFYLKRLRERRA